MGIIHKIKKRVGAAQGDIPSRGPTVHEGFLDIEHILHKSLLVSHMTLKNLAQTLYLIEIRGRGLLRTTHLENLRRPNLLLLMVR